MTKKGSVTGGRAWNILRLALLWARKGGVFRNRMAINLNVLQKGIRKLRHWHHTPTGALVYGHRQLSFDDTPIIHVKMHRPSSLRFKMPQIPCIKPPQVDFDYYFDVDDDNDEMFDCIDHVKEDDEGIDLKAEEFIAKFYKQMKLQRQISYLQFNEQSSS